MNTQIEQFLKEQRSKKISLLSLVAIPIVFEERFDRINYDYYTVAASSDTGEVVSSFKPYYVD